MAKVELDISEYELMKENAKLLENSLEREKKLSEENRVLQQANIDTLKNNEKSVTTIVKSQVTTYSRAKVPYDDIVRYLKSRVYEVSNAVLNSMQESSGDMHFFHSGSDRFRHPTSSMMASGRADSYIESAIDHFMGGAGFDRHGSKVHDLFFEKESFSTKNFDDEVRTKGLDEVKTEMEDIAFERLTLKAKKALTDIVIVAKERDDTSDQFNDLNKSIFDLEENVKLSKSLNESKDLEIKDILFKLSESEAVRTLENRNFKEISLLLSGETRTFGNRKLVTNIKQILNK
jgi:hypothetical protein